MNTDVQDVTAESEIRALMDDYLRAVRTWDEALFRSTFDANANIAHYYVRGDEVRTISLDQFVDTIRSLHEKFDNAQEIAEHIEVSRVGHLASVRVDFRFVMGSKEPQGSDLFNLAKVKGRWVIIHKSYWL
ncbi:nuclear transport factor 2 family protein [Pararobbsia silviterrae]|nr:nuclear transport factor 2 family protein [Pararobbsia silviterrae]